MANPEKLAALTAKKAKLVKKLEILGKKQEDTKQAILAVDKKAEELAAQDAKKE